MQSHCVTIAAATVVVVVVVVDTDVTFVTVIEANHIDNYSWGFVYPVLLQRDYCHHRHGYYVASNFHELLDTAAVGEE